MEIDRSMRNAWWNCRCATNAVLLAVIFSTAGGAMAGGPPGFDAQVAPILQKNCLACHSNSGRMGGLVMESYDGLIKGGTHGGPIVPGNADGSRIIQMLEGKIAPRMPFGADALPAADIAANRAWINAAAPGPAGQQSRPPRFLGLPRCPISIPWYRWFHLWLR